MKKMKKWLVLVGSILAFSSVAQAQEAEPVEDVPEEVDPPAADPNGIAWDDSTRLALGQCFVGEAGWRNRTEHAIMAHLLERRWRMVRSNHPRYTFEQMVRRYCAVHRVRTPSDRQLWVRHLPWGPMTEDPGMDGEHTNWANWIDDWDYVRETVGLFEAGTLPDPLPAAEHWGGSMDGVPVGGVLLARAVESVVNPTSHVALHNRFYRIDYEAARRYREYQRRMREDPTAPVVVDPAYARRRS